MMGSAVYVLSSTSAQLRHHNRGKQGAELLHEWGKHLTNGGSVVRGPGHHRQVAAGWRPRLPSGDGSEVTGCQDEELRETATIINASPGGALTASGANYAGSNCRDFSW